MYRFILITILLFFFSFLGLYAQDKEIAFQYYIQAKQLFDNGSYDSAKELLLDSIEFYPDFSDALYLLARIYEKNQETTLTSLEYYHKAMKVASWISVAPSQSLTDLAGLLLRIRRYKEALAAVASIQDTYTTNARVELIKARAYSGLGLIKNALQVFRSALRVYPYTLELYTAYIDFLLENRLFGEARSVIESGLSEFKDQPDILYYRIATERDASVKKELIDQYIALKGNRPDIALMALALPKNAAKKYIDFFISAGGPAYADLLRRLFSLLSKNASLLPYTQQQIGTADGVKIIDNDRDGYYEEKYTFKRGVLTQWIADYDQDGRADILLNFNNQTPVSLKIFDTAGKQIEYLYNVYPAVKQACFYNKDTVTCYDLIPSSIMLSVVNLPKNNAEPVYKITTRPKILFPNEKMIKDSAFAGSQRNTAANLPFKKWEFKNGKKTKLIEDTDGNLMMDHIVLYNNEVPVSGMQDLDGDGVFEITEQYTKGKLTTLKFDGDGDGNPDYIQNYTAGERKMWDLNSDGKFDVIEYTDSDGKVIRKYSTRLNGVFDLTIYVQ